MTDESPQNPYKSPATNGAPSPVPRPDIPTIIAITFLSLLAAAGAFYVTCFGTVSIGWGLGWVHRYGPIPFYAISTLAALVVAVRIFRWRYRKETVSGTVFKDKARRQLQMIPYIIRSGVPRRPLIRRQRRDQAYQQSPLHSFWGLWPPLQRFSLPALARCYSFCHYLANWA